MYSTKSSVFMVRATVKRKAFCQFTQSPVCMCVSVFVCAYVTHLLGPHCQLVSPGWVDSSKGHTHKKHQQRCSGWKSLGVTLTLLSVNTLRPVYRDILCFSKKMCVYRENRISKMTKCKWQAFGRYLEI